MSYITVNIGNESFKVIPAKKERTMQFKVGDKVAGTLGVGCREVVMLEHSGDPLTVALSRDCEPAPPVLPKLFGRTITLTHCTTRGTGFWFDAFSAMYGEHFEPVLRAARLRGQRDWGGAFVVPCYESEANILRLIAEAHGRHAIAWSSRYGSQTAALVFNLSEDPRAFTNADKAHLENYRLVERINIATAVARLTATIPPAITTLSALGRTITIASDGSATAGGETTTLGDLEAIGVALNIEAAK